jgi:hypothetical protein
MRFSNQPTPRQRFAMNLKWRLAIQLLFLAVVSLMIVQFALEAKKEPAPGERGGVVSLGPFAPPKGLVELTPWHEGEEQEVADDALSCEGDARSEPTSAVVDVTELVPFKERPDVLAGAASRDRESLEEGTSIKRVKEEAVGYHIHRLLWERKEGAEVEPVLSTLRGDRVWEKLMADPDRYRGQLVEVRGQMLRADAHEPIFKVRSLPDDRPLGTDRAYRSYFFDEHFDVRRCASHYLVYTAEDQTAELEHFDGVVLRGYFCRLFQGKIELADGVGDRSIPVLVGLRYEKLPSESSGRYNVLYYLPVGLGVLAVGGLAIWIIARRGESSYEARRRAARSAASGAPGRASGGTERGPEGGATA